MVTAMINIPKEYDEKAAIYKIRSGARSKNEVYEKAIKEFLDNEEL